MPKVESEITIKAPLPLVWELAQDVEKLPDIMPDLDKVLLLERRQLTEATTRVVTEWHARIKQFNRSIDWVEEDIWNSADYTCHFWQIRGDFTDYRGLWRFEAIDGSTGDGSTRADLVVDYSFEIPLLGAMIKKVLQKLMQENADTMLRCLRDEAERRAAQSG